MKKQKKTKKFESKSAEVSLIGKNYCVGNFYQVRKIAKELLKRSDTDESLQAAAGEALVKTGIDKITFIAGFSALAFSCFIAYLASY